MSGTTNFTNVTADGTVVATVMSAAGYSFPKVISQTVGYSVFTNGTTVGTYAMTGTVPAGATFHRSAVTAIGQGFSGTPIVSANLTIGDGTDADRYCGTAGIDVFTTAAGGGDAGTPSGVQYHTAAKQPVLTITPGTAVAAVWGSVTAGTVTVKLYYFD